MTVFSESDLARFRADGYAVLRSVLTPAEILVLQSEGDRLQKLDHLMQPSNLRTVSRSTISGGEVIDRFDPVIDLSEPLRALVRDERLLSPLRCILEDEPILFKDKIIFKEPQTSGYMVHQDYTVWRELPAPAEAIISVMVAIDDSSPASGAVEFFPRLHRKHYCEQAVRDIFDPAYGVVPQEVVAGLEPDIPSLAAGDLVILSSLTPHRSGPNRSQKRRCAVVLSYNAGRFGNLYDLYYRTFRHYLTRDRTGAGTTGRYFQ